MAFSEHTRRLEQSFRATAELQQNLLRCLKERRTAWISARPKTLAPSPELEQLAQALAREEALQRELTAAIGRFLPHPPGHAATDLHVNVTRIAEALAPEAARSLREAAEAATALAKAVRTEVTVGQRLLRFSQRVQQSLAGHVGDLKGASGRPGYDRQARRQGALGNREGTLVDGRI
ncbi:MAG: hypothetical protein ABIP94_04850 [Planctomycetota bacterium]